jgi:mannose-6-phosphate isomerase-like protein (cupin superfamily)
MEGIRILRFDQPEDRRDFPLGHLDLVDAEGLTLGRAEYEPGWKWSEHVGAALGQVWCQTPHVGLVLEGHNRVVMEDGTTMDMGPGDIFVIGPGHDSWVLGDERYVSIHFLGADTYATAHQGD